MQPTRRTTRSRLLVTTLAVAGLVLAACGDDDSASDAPATTAGRAAPTAAPATSGGTTGSSDAPTASAPAASAPAASKPAGDLPEYKIGWVGPLTGPLAVGGGHSEDALKAAVEYANSLGVATFTYEMRDTGGDPTKAVNLARELGQSGAKALLTGTSEFAAIQPVANQFKMFTSDGGGFTGIVDKVGTNREFKWAFCPNTACGASTVLPEVQFLTEVDPDGVIGELYGTDPYGSGTHDLVEKLVKEQFPDVKMISEGFPLTATSVEAQLQKLKDQGATSLLVWTYGSPLVMVMQTLDNMGWYPWVVGPLGVGDPAVVAAMPAALKGKAIAGGIAASQVSDSPGAEATGMNKTYFDLYQKYAKDPEYSGLSTIASYPFDFLVMLSAAVEATGSTDNEKMLEWITAGHTIETAEGPQTFGPDGDERIGTSLETTTVYDPQYPCTKGVCVAPKR